MNNINSSDLIYQLTLIELKIKKSIIEVIEDVFASEIYLEDQYQGAELERVKDDLFSIADIVIRKYELGLEKIYEFYLENDKSDSESIKLLGRKAKSILDLSVDEKLKLHSRIVELEKEKNEYKRLYKQEKEKVKIFITPKEKLQDEVSVYMHVLKITKNVPDSKMLETSSLNTLSEGTWRRRLKNREFLFSVLTKVNIFLDEKSAEFEAAPLNKKGQLKQDMIDYMNVAQKLQDSINISDNNELIFNVDLRNKFKKLLTVIIPDLQEYEKFYKNENHEEAGDFFDSEKTVDGDNDDET